MQTKICTKCGEEKILSEFGKDKHSKDGLSYKCKDCKNDYQNTKEAKEYREKYYKNYFKTDNGKEILKKSQERFLNKITFCCQDCGNKIALSTALYGQGRCKKCSRTLEVRKRLSKAHKNQKHSKETCLKISKATKGKNNPRYINGLSLVSYNRNFSDELKLKIRCRDNHVCQNCGIIEEEHIKKYGRVLSIHHIDYNKENCKEDNLITTCTICNIKANGNKEFDRSYWYSYYRYKIDNLRSK